jgi:hypothetical protein
MSPARWRDTVRSSQLVVNSLFAELPHDMIREEASIDRMIPSRVFIAFLPARERPCRRPTDSRFSGVARDAKW